MSSTSHQEPNKLIQASKAEIEGAVEVTDDNYGSVLDQYMSDIKHNDRMQKEMRKMEAMEKTFRNGLLDFVFPWHMQLGRFEKGISADGIEEDEFSGEFAYTPFKTFNRRRNFLIWM